MGLRFKESQTGAVSIEGSLHVFYNGGAHNYDDFTFEKLTASLSRFTKQIGIDPSTTKLNNVEFGVNVYLDFDPKFFINSLLCYRSTSFTIHNGKSICQATAEASQYVLKIYDKGLQNKLTNNVLRFEIKIKRMAKIATYGIETLQDLLNRDKLNSIKYLLLDVFDNIIYCDDTVDTGILEKKDSDLVRDANNPRYWMDHYSQTGKNASKKIRKYKKLIRENGKMNYHRIRDIICEKWDNLLACNETGRVLTTSDDHAAGNPVRVFTDPLVCTDNGSLRVFTNRPQVFEESQEQIANNTTTSQKNPEKRFGNSNNTSFYNLSRERDLVPLSASDRKCDVTNLDISMQKEGSRFLNVAGIRHIYRNNPDLYKKLLSYIPVKHRNEELTIQIYKIAHTIRDLYFNKRNYTRRAINKLCSQPSLFNNLALISEEKKAIAVKP